MRRGTGIMALIMAFGFAGFVYAQDEKKAEDPKKPERPARPARPEAPKVDLDEIFKKLDADGDGKISKDEFKKLQEVYKPAGRLGGAANRFQNLDPEQLKKLQERFGGQGGFDPERLKKLQERFKKPS